MILPRRSRRLLAVAALGSLVAGPARAHFVLQSPPAMHEQSQLGDPQKAPPCGDNGGAVATGAVTSYQGGDVVTITINETIFHPGHYRVALALNDPSELPEEPPVTPNNTDCGTTPIMDPPVFPVLADGVFAHTQPFDQPQSIDITLPKDINCDHCTLQVIQFMSNHGLNNPGGCFYHHCATVSVESGAAATTTGADESGGEGTASPTLTTDPTDPSGAASSDGETGQATNPDPTATTATGTASATGDAPTTSATATGTASGGEASSDGSSSDGSDGGCGCSGARGEAGTASLVALLGLLGLRRRRRAS